MPKSVLSYRRRLPQLSGHNKYFPIEPIAKKDKSNLDLLNGAHSDIFVVGIMFASGIF